MTTFEIKQCTIADAAAISRNNMSAFWENPSWVLSWRHTTLEEHINTVSNRYPKKLLNERTTTRHQKAVDKVTGQLVGYARWVIPSSYATNENGELFWPEAIVPEVGAEVEEEINRVAAATPWNPNTEPDVMDEAVHVIKEKLLGRKDYLLLDYLAVHPENQRKGIASALVQEGMQRAQALGLDIFVLALADGMNLYTRLGFKLEDQLIQDDTKYGGKGEYASYFMTYEVDRT